jgi:hypothetical protein
MQKIAPRVFIISSVIFGVLGILIVLFGTGPDKDATGYKLVLSKLFMVNIFVILTSFALSVAGKYLDDKS